MTSKEALSDLFFLAIGDEKHTKKCKETIEKDLEILEIIKNHILNIDIDTSGIYLEFHNGHYEPYYTVEVKEGIKKIVSIEEYTKLKEWLENESTK